MSLYDFKISQDISKEDPPFYSLIMAAIRKADTPNLEKFKYLFPEVVEEFTQRYNAPGGKLPND